MGVRILATTVAAIIVATAGTVFAAATSGEAIFTANCATCHPYGGNRMNPKKALKHIKTPDTVIKQLRNGGGGMPAFDAKSISDADARLLADYIIRTFKK